MEAITRDRANHERRFPYLQHTLTERGRTLLAQLEAEQQALDARKIRAALIGTVSVDEAVIRLQKKIDEYEYLYSNLQEEMVRRQRLDASAERAAKKKAAEARKREREAADQALADRAKGAVRETAAQIRSKLRRDHGCPYCGGVLGIAPHADHIHPVRKGGLSTLENMVYVCAPCNSAKRDLTLNQFIDKHELNRELIIYRLRELGKDY